MAHVFHRLFILFADSFLVADRVYVASTPTASEANPNPIQHVFSSSSEDSAFEIYPDPRGNSLVHGTEITLVLNKEATEYLENRKLEDIMFVLLTLLGSF